MNEDRTKKEEQTIEALLESTKVVLAASDRLVQLYKEFIKKLEKELGR